MRASRGPWWLYVVSTCFIAYFTFLICTRIGDPGLFGIEIDSSSDTLLVQKVYPTGPAARAGLRAGDRILTVDGIPIRREKVDYDFFFRAAANLEPRRSIAIEIERQNKPIELTLIPERKTLRDLDWIEWERMGAALFTFVLALTIGIRRPLDPVVRIGAWLLADMAFNMAIFPPGWSASWRHLPIALGLVLWPGLISSTLTAGVGVTFATVFPRKLLHKTWVWVLIWSPVALVAVFQWRVCWRLIYQPKGIPTSLDLFDMFSIVNLLGLAYVLAALILLGVQYRRLEDVNDKRRMRIFFVGATVGCLAISAIAALELFNPVWYTYSIFGCLMALYAAGPLALAYVVLRHRVFDLGLIVRRGLQYALARRALVSAVPILAAIFIADLLLHGDQPILIVVRTRGWIYGALAALAAVAYTKRRNWLEALDRRFFRERYDARRLLCEVVEEVHVALSFGQEAPQVTARIESALHPEFVALLVSEPREKFYRSFAASPAGTGPPPLPRESKLLSLMRLLGKPLEVPQTGTSWLRQQLPHDGRCTPKGHFRGVPAMRRLL